MKQPLSLPDAEIEAARIAEVLRDSGRFLRIEVAGSIRRQKPEVGDIELVAEGNPDEILGFADAVRAALSRARVQRAEPNKAGAKAPWGPRYYKGVNARGTQVDLFVVLPPAEWGVVYLIRTGSADFSHSIVTRLHRFSLKSESGRIVNSATGEVVPCPDEETFFRLAELPYVDPRDRT